MIELIVFHPSGSGGFQEFMVFKYSSNIHPMCFLENRVRQNPSLNHHAPMFELP